eukprot:jgi/Hompol1/2020/HPOL_002804-RA
MEPNKAATNPSTIVADAAQHPRHKPTASHISQFRPLPEEILRMGEAETACQYCGISYLLLTKYERMEAHVKEVDMEFAKLKKYVEERPQMMTRLESMLMHQKLIEEELRDTTLELQEYRARAKRDAEILASTVESQKAVQAQLVEYLRPLILDKALQQQKLAVEAAHQAAALKFQTTIKMQQKEIKSLNEALEESQQRCDRLTKELGAFRKEYVGNVEGQKSYMREMQSSYCVLEDRLHEANRQVMTITAEREKCYAENIKLQKQLEQIQSEHTSVCDSLERRAIDLQTQLGRLQEQLMQMERTIRELNTNLAAMRAERVKTIEAHQSRIKQLQEKFLEDLRRAGSEEAAKVESELRRGFVEQLNTALREQQKSLNLEFEEAKTNLLKQIDALKLQVSKSVAHQHMEEEWARRNSELQEHISKLQASSSAELNHYQVKIRALEQELARAQAELQIQGSGTERDRIAQLSAAVAKRDAEITFLKDTVRLECEERMGLVAMVTKLKQGASQSQATVQQTEQDTSRRVSGQGHSIPTSQ